MKIKEILITPYIAAEMLEHNTRNRPLNKAHVSFLAKEMKDGRWKVNGDTICINGNVLIDGQHRLAACIEANYTMQSILVSDLTHGVFDTKDCGRRRGAADVLAIHGEKAYAMLSATLIVIDRYMTGNLGATRKRYANSEILNLLQKHTDARISVAFIQRLGTKRLIPGSLLAGLHYLFSKKDELFADEFCKKLISGVDLEETSPIYILRERLVSNTLSKAKLKQEYIAALSIKAWNYSRKEKQLKNLRFIEKGLAEKYPIIE